MHIFQIFLTVKKTLLFTDVVLFTTRLDIYTHGKMLDDAKMLLSILSIASIVSR